MNIQEAAQLIKQGKKVKLKRWFGNDNISSLCGFVNEGNFENDESWVEDLISDDWEEDIEELKLHTFADALESLKDGKKIKQLSGDNRNYFLSTNIHPNADIICEYSSGTRFFCNFTGEEVLANDWIILENEEVNHE